MSDYEKLLDNVRNLGYNSVKEYTYAVAEKYLADVDDIRYALPAFVGDLVGFEQFVKERVKWTS